MRLTYLLNPMRTTFIASFIAVIIILFAITPASAAYVMSDLALAPEGPLVPGTQLEVIATYALLPSGSTTFVPGHNLQMTTDLAGAKWNIQVIVDGRNAARQTGSGNAVFVNGEILSYPTTRDVSFMVTIDGAVPDHASGQATVLRIGEVDNTGGIVPGSLNVLNEPLAGQIPLAGATKTPAQTPIPAYVPVTVPSTTKSSGFTSFACIAAIGTGCVLLSRRAT